jgi:hypothetical protein
MKYLIIGAMLAYGVAASAAPHVHGLARLTVTLEDTTLTIALESPLDNLLGFEHEPRTAEQRAALAEMVAALRAPASLFAPTAGAGCTSAAVVLESPLLAPTHHNRDHNHDHDHDHDHHHHHHSHTDLYAEFVFDCITPGDLRGIDVELFARFPRLERIDAEIAAHGRQTAQRLDARNATLRWR